MRITTLSARRKAMAATATLSLVAASAAGIVMAPAASAASAITLSSASGKSGGGNALTATTSVATFNSGLAATFQYKGAGALATCSAAYPASLTALAVGTGMLAVAAPQILSTKKIAFTVPALTLVPSGTASAAYNLCVYSGTTPVTSLLTANATYTVAAAPVVSGISATGGTPATTASGPALGGGTLTITGTGFTGTTSASTTTAKIGTVPLTNVAWLNATTLTGTVPPQSAATGLSVSVSNTGGTASLLNAYSYTNGITVSPNTTTATAAVDVDVQGVGFSGLTFTGSGLGTTGSTIQSASAHVYITDGKYDSTTSAKLVPELGECVAVLLISDAELICTVDPEDADGAGAGDPTLDNGTYTLTLVSDGSSAVHTVGAAGYSETILTSGSTFTVAPY